MSWRSWVAVTFCALLTANTVFAADSADALQAAISQSADKFAEAFAKKDAKAIAALFTAEAEYVNADGTVFHGRAAIEAELSATFAAGPPGKVAIELVSIRPVAAGLVVEDGVSTFRSNEDDASTQTRYTATHLRQPDGSWLMASVRELSEPAVSAHDRLKSLAWLLGRWREENPDSVVNTEWKWTHDGTALLAHFTTRHASGDAKTGSHRVGWDAERKQFRSWIFDSTGGFADGWWTADDDGSWSVSLHGVDAEGSRVATLLSYTHDDDALTITQNQRVRGGVTLPSITSRVVRQPPAASVDVSIQ
jgi:uncharacterized protein (TIGR02246 family)